MDEALIALADGDFYADYDRGMEYLKLVREALAERDRYKNALMTIAEWNAISTMTDLPSPQDIARDELRSQNGREPT